MAGEKPSSSLIIVDESLIIADEVEEDVFYTDDGELAEANYIDELIRQKLEKRPFSHEPAATDFSQWPPKGQIPKCDICHREFRSRMSYEKHMFEHRRSLNTTGDKAKASKSFLYINAGKQRKELEEALARETEVAKEMKSQKENIIKELQAAEEQKSALESKLAASVQEVQELENKFEAAVDLSTILRKQRDEIQFERDNTVREAVELRNKDTLVIEVVKMQKDNLMKELRTAQTQILALRNQLADSDRMVKELVEKNYSASDLWITSKNERDKIQIEHENTVREAAELRKRGTLVIEDVKMQKDNVMKELRAAQTQILTLQNKLADSDRIIKELVEKNQSASELLVAFKKERDDAIREAEELRQGREDATANLETMQFFSAFSFEEIEEATRRFNPLLIIGEGGYGNVFKGTLRNTNVAIKILHPNSLQGRSEFQKEVDVLSRVRHPNLVTLIGTCPEASALIYEYLANGSLEDRLMCKNNALPLSWQTRARIVVEICSALIFLHSSKPHSIIHGDLKPANVLLDANLVSKLGDFGICRLIHFDGNATDITTPFCETNPKGTIGYIDPEFLSTGELTAKSDVYSFGVILLRLLTGRPAVGLVNEVQSALEKEDLDTLLDASAGEWPLIQAQRLSQLALRCCKMNRRNRPDLSQVFRVLKMLRTSYGDAL